MRKRTVFMPMAITLALAFFMFGCEKQSYHELGDNENSPEIRMKVGQKVVGINDTLLVERGVSVSFLAISNGPNIVTWQWTFADGSAFGPNTSHTFRGDYFSVTEVRLIGVADDDQTYQRILQVKILPALDGLPAVKEISSTPLGGGIFRIVMAANKAAMKTKGDFFYIGDVTATDWVATLIPAVDTNFYVISNALVLPTNAAEIAKFVAVRMILTPGKYQMGVGRIFGGNQYWGIYWGAFVNPSNPTLIKFEVDINGHIIDDANAVVVNLPGTSGDQGANAVIRTNQKTDSLILYINNEAPFSGLSPFIVLQDSVGNWSAPLLETPVAGFDNWGMRKIAYTDMPMNYELVFKAGSNSANPTIFNSNQSLSSYWDPYFGVEKIGLAISTH